MRGNLCETSRFCVRLDEVWRTKAWRSVGAVVEGGSKPVVPLLQKLVETRTKWARPRRLCKVNSGHGGLMLLSRLMAAVLYPMFLCGKKKPICQDYHFLHTLNSSEISNTHAKKYWENKCIKPQLEPRSALSIFRTTSRYQPQCAGGWSARGELPGLTDFTCRCRTLAW